MFTNQATKFQSILMSFVQIIFTSLVISTASLALADEKKPAEKPKPKETKPTKPESLKLKTEKFAAMLELTGVIESKVMTRVAVRPDSWTDLPVEKVVDHGTEVKQGDVLLSLDTKKLKLAIEDQEKALPTAKLKLEGAKLDFEVRKKSQPLQIEQLQLTKQNRKDDYAYYEKVELPNNVRNAKERLKTYQNYLLYAEEELKQLKKMYENDDMTEETEEIILKRAQDTVNRERWNVEQMESSTDRRLKTTIPREQTARKRSARLAEIAEEIAEVKAKQNFEISRLEFETQKRALEKTETKLKELKGDLDKMVVTAPHDGIVYYGANQRGKWTTAATIEKKLFPGGRVTANETLMTVADPTKLQLRVGVAEDKLKELSIGKKARIAMKWNSDLKFDATVEKISYVPLPTATYDVVLAIDLAENNKPILPGMSAKIKIYTYQSDAAIVIPKTVIKEEDEKFYVKMKDGSKRWVTPGATQKDKQVILKGLKAGEEISTKPDK